MNIKKYDIQVTLKEFLTEIERIKNHDDITKIKIKYLGRKGIINNIIKNIINIPADDRKKFGALVNETKKYINNKINDIIKKKNITTNKISEIDITLPGLNEEFGSEHIINKTIQEVEYFFLMQGFTLIKEKEIDNVINNFDLLNIQNNHPSRSYNETFYIKKNIILRTHTSNMQTHAIKKNIYKAISCGKVYRRDSDASHTPMFHQIEGFIIDKNITILDLKTLMTNFLEYFFKKNIKINMRNSYFPFTEPSMEIDIECIVCKGKKCSLCKHSGWIEILGCGLIHPKVLKNFNINNNYYNGLAFGMGIERLTMIKYKIPDLRLFFENNLDFLNQF